MKTLTARTNTTAMVALLIVAGAFFGPSASAREMKVRFVYNPAASAEQIYSGFEHTAQRACHTYGPAPLAMRKQDDACVADFLGKAVTLLGRADVAQIHHGNHDMVASR